MLFLTPNQQRQSTEGKSYMTRIILLGIYNSPLLQPFKESRQIYRLLRSAMSILSCDSCRSSWAFSAFSFSTSALHKMPHQWTFLVTAKQHRFFGTAWTPWKVLSLLWFPTLATVT